MKDDIVFVFLLAISALAILAVTFDNYDKRRVDLAKRFIEQEQRPWWFVVPGRVYLLSRVRPSLLTKLGSYVYIMCPEL